MVYDPREDSEMAVKWTNGDKDQTIGDDRGPWIMTFTGRHFHFMHPALNEVDIMDIAVSTSREGRFAGHCWSFYCVTGDTKILTHDFKWVRADDITTGDCLWGFDDEPRGKLKRRWRKSRAIVHGLVEREVVRIILSDGTNLKCSVEHPLLVSAKRAGNQKWMTAGEILKRYLEGRVTYLPKFTKPCWSENKDFDGGWLSGMFDGEGTISSEASRGHNLSVCQKEGRICERLRDLLDFYCYDFSEYFNKDTGVVNITLHGGISEQMRFLGEFRPIRLVPKMEKRLEGSQMNRVGNLVHVVEVIPMGKEMVVALETSTNTYITEGFGSHNSVAQHCVHVSERVEMLLQQTGLKDPLHIAKVSMCALLHDASEGYIKDMPSPVKAHLPDYRRMEDTVQDVIVDCFGLLDLWKAPQTQSIIHTVDKAVMATEVRDLIKHKKVWHMPEKAYDDLKIVPVGPDTACVQFLYRFHSLKRILDENAS